MRPEISTVPKSEHFELQRLAEGVYAAIAIEGGAAYSNAGIIDLGDQTLIFDTFETHTAAVDLRMTAERLTGRPASWVIISHAHPDHWMGNQVFSFQTPIITTQESRAAMQMYADDILETKANLSELEELIRQEEENFRTERDSRRRISQQNMLSRLRHELAMLPDLSIRFPNQTFNCNLSFHGPLRVAELVSVGHAHTSGDCCLMLPDDRIAFLGDIGFFQSQPSMANCDPQGWTELLEKLEQSEYETLIPGHGPIGNRKDLNLQKRYIAVLEEMIGQVIADDGKLEQALEIELPEPFDAWLNRGLARFEANVRTRYLKMRK
jgi:cyclase